MWRVARLLRSIKVTAVLLALPVLACAQSQRYGGPRDRSMTSAFLVTRFGAKCDGNTDDTRAFQAALNAAGAGCGAGKGYLDSGYQTVLVPDGARCRLNSGLINNRSDCVGISSYAGGVLDFSGLPHGQTALTLKPLIYGAYTGNVARFENIQMIGPGRSSGTVGIASSTATTTYRQYNIHGFGHGYEVHSGSWLNHFMNTSIWDCRTDLYCGSSLKDAGEQISFEAGTLFNSDQGIENDSCEFTITDSSLDEFTGPAVVNGGGTTRLTSDHIEYVNSTTGAPLVVTNKACNAWGSITMEGGQIQFDHAKPQALARNDGGPGPCGGGGWGSYIRLNNVFLGNIPTEPNGAPVVTGSNSSQIAICHATNGAGGGAVGNVPNIGRPYKEGQSQC
jgi:hypothetical protein